ncbi:MAG: glycosyltransferase [Chloroflexi bacterium]|nr:glycosyltransferase [Chloroflexota bacterium]
MLNRIAYISVHGCPLRRLGERDTGGMNVYLLALARELGRHGLSIDIYTREHDPRDPRVVDIGEGARVVHIPAGPYREEKDNIHLHLGQFLRGVLSFTQANSLSYDIVHGHYWLSAKVASALKRRWGVPLAVSFHTLGEVKRRARKGQQERPVRIATERQVITKADALFAFNPDEKEQLVRLYHAPPDRVRVVPGGVDLSLFHPLDMTASRKQLGLPEKGLVALYVGRVEPFKGVDLLLEATALLKRWDDLTVLVVGGGSAGHADVERLSALATELGIAERLRFTGSVPHHALPAYYSAADVCVVPSYYESFGFVAVEAMACGTPVVATQVGGLAVTVEDGQTGYLLPERSASLLAERIERLLQEPSLRRRMGLAARARMSRFTWPVVARQVMAEYHALWKKDSFGALGGHDQTAPAWSCHR